MKKPPSLFLDYFTPAEIKMIESINPRDLTSELNILRSHIASFIAVNPYRDPRASRQDRTSYLQTLTTAMDYLGKLVSAYIEADTFMEEFDRQAEEATNIVRLRLGILDWDKKSAFVDPASSLVDQTFDDFKPISFGSQDPPASP